MRSALAIRETVEMTLPIARNIPEIDFNIGGLRSHAILSIFVAESGLSEADRKIRGWLLHTVFSAARHYSRARELVAQQNDADQQQDGGLVLHLLDVSENIEDCVTGVYRSCMAVRRMVDKSEPCREFVEAYSQEIDGLAKLRNQFEHMHGQIVSGETGSGPISMSLSDQGKAIGFRKLRFDIVSLYKLIRGLYQVVASMYPSFPINSIVSDRAWEPKKLTMSASATVIKKGEFDG